MTNHSRDTNRRTWAPVLFLAFLAPACATDVPLDVYADAGLERLSVAPDDALEPDTWYVEHFPEYPDPEAVAAELGDDPLDGLSDDEIHDLWFGDSGWGCCEEFLRPGLCAALRDRCDDDEVLTANEAGTACCSPNFGQCSEWVRPSDDSDAGI